MPARLATPVLTLCLAGAATAVWRLLYPLTDWAGVALGLLALLVFMSNWQVGITLHRARLQAALQPDSPLRHWLTGRVRTFLSAFAFACAFLVLAAAQVLEADPLELTLYGVLTGLTALTTCGSRHILLRHLRPPFAAAAAVTLSTLICGLIFTPLLFVAAWTYKSFPGEIRGAATLAEAALAGLRDLPPRGGWIAEALAPIRAFEAAKLWLATRAAWAGWGPLLFAAESAVFSFVLARAAALMSLIVASTAGSKDP
ncbi:hypothetical protein [Antarctobacter heliothermus]|uniref:Uncharacterized protein n=1 Tax=Antarctobacter heliothermus TaxID=74033 RepID=A0A239IVZ2_9RHOB|nr:hypothetical protein [Antarctobacter heliothermus]SNS97173.1 hypothetical protein SAMN04488078_10467 [Antarctobacter heliothermus]